jgi:hypothetical protein
VDDGKRAEIAAHVVQGGVGVARHDGVMVYREPRSRLPFTSSPC